MNWKYMIGIALVASMVSTLVSLGFYYVSELQAHQAVDAQAKLDKRLFRVEQQLSELRSLSAIKKTSHSMREVAPDETLKPIESGLSEEFSEQATSKTSTERIQKEFKAEALQRQQPAYFQSRLVNNGFTVEEAAWIIKSESEFALAGLQDQYQRRKSKHERTQEEGNRASGTKQSLRAKLGDNVYERYLETKGLPTAIQISRVISGSPADTAGLVPGDQLRSYAGQRVFNRRDLSSLIVEGREGENVLLEVERDDNLVHLTIPRGPIGIRGN